MTLLSSLLLATTATAAAPKAPAVLAIVNGVPIKRVEMMDRAWKQYGTAVLNDTIDDILIHQASKFLAVKPDAQEVAARLRRIMSQFPDEATFSARLAATGTSLPQLRGQIEEQVLRENLVAKAKGLQVTEAELKAAFDANKDRLASPDAIRIRHIVVANEKEAADFLIAIKAGADFAKLASQVSLDNGTKDRGGDAGFLSHGMLLPELEKAISGLKPGQVAGPVKTPLGYHLLKVEEIRPAAPAVFDNVKGELRASLLADKVSKAWPDFLRELRAKAKIETPKG